MRNVMEVLEEKLQELARLEKEVEALRTVAPLLAEKPKFEPGTAAPAEEQKRDVWP